MPKRLKIVHHLSCEEMWKHRWACQNVAERLRWRALALLAEGAPSESVSSDTGLSAHWLRTLARRYNEQGPEALRDRRHQHPGPKHPLSPEQQSELAKASAIAFGITLTRGQKVSLSHAPSHLRVRFSVQAPGLTLDFSCFALSDKGQLLDERYFVFYNQKQSPEGAVRMASDTDFEIELDRLPTAIQKLVFVVTVDSSGELQQMDSGFFGLWSHGGQVARFDFRGADFGREKVVMMAEIYRREGWRLSAVGQGFVVGLNGILAHFGGQVEEMGAPSVPTPTPSQFDSGQPKSLACVRRGKHGVSSRNGL